jgi:hypothetical protein
MLKHGLLVALVALVTRDADGDGIYCVIYSR